MSSLQLVRADHGPAILAFELENRGYFTELISDRGDEYFDRFEERHNECDLARASISLLLKGPSGRLSFQDHVSEVADFAAMWTWSWLCITSIWA